MCDGVTAMNHNDHRRLQQEIINQVLAILKNDSHVLGCVLAGSYARGEHDAFFDLDIACYLRDEERTGRQELFEQVGKIAPTLWQLWIYDQHALYLFENGVRLDLDFCKPSDTSAPTDVYSDTIVAYDPDGIIHQLMIQNPVTLQPAEHPKWFEPGDPAMIDWFFWMFRQVVCWAKRGAQGDYRSFDKLTNAISSLAEIRTRLVEMRFWTLGFKDYLGRVEPFCAARLAQTYPHFQAGEIIECARLLLAEYETICLDYCQKAKADYPARKVEIMYLLIEEFEQLE
jgi:predicted nucleotidyltransferase